MYSVIQFCEKDGGTVSIINNQWFTPRRCEVFWRPVKGTKAYDRLLADAKTPDDKWKLYGVQRVFYETDDIEKAKQKLKLVEDTSDLQTEEETAQTPKRRRTKKYISSSEEDAYCDTHIRPPHLKRKTCNLLQKFQAGKTISLETYKEDTCQVQPNITQETPSSLESLVEDTEEPITLDARLDGSPQCRYEQRPNLGKGVPATPPFVQGLTSSAEDTEEPITVDARLDGSPQCRYEQRPNLGKDVPATPPCAQGLTSYQTKVVSLLSSIRTQNDQILCLLKQTGAEKLKGTLKPELKFPIKNDDDMKNIEMLIRNKENYDNLVTYIRTIGGRDISSKVSRIMSSLCPPSASYDTIVVGLGSAGVTAATTLARAGRRVLGLEAQDRVGGRVHTVPFGNGLAELGAEWIHGTVNSRTYDLAIQYNVSILPTPMDMMLLRSDAKEVDKGLVSELLEFCLGVVDQQPPEQPEPLGDFTTRKLMEYITERKPELLNEQAFITQVLDFINLYISGYNAVNDWNDMSTTSTSEDLGGNQAMSWNRNGYKTFFDIMLNKYNNGPGLSNLDIKLSTEVTQITAPQHPDEKVVVKCKDGSSYEADNVIVTVSIGVLKAKHSSLFSAPLPEDKQTAIDKISLGVLDKVILAFDEPWWPQNNVSLFGFMWRAEDREKVSQEDRWTTVTMASRPMGASNVLTMWFNGDAAKKVETLPEDVVETKCVELLQKFVGNYLQVTVPKPNKIIRTRWYSNRFVRGSYSYDNLLTPQYLDARAWLGAPLTDSAGAPRVLFAGEATNIKHYGTVHGASETGFREAERLLKPTSTQL